MAYGAQEGNRTPDLRITSALLYRLSYLGRTVNFTDGSGQHLRQLQLLRRGKGMCR